MNYETNYYVATHWLHNNLILCNEIPAIDETIWDNMHFSLTNEEDENYKEIFQWFLTDCSEDDVQWLEQHFGLLFTYSEKLDLWVLCVDHYGTTWDYVYWTTDIKNGQAKLGDKLGL